MMLFRKAAGPGTDQGEGEDNNTQLLEEALSRLTALEEFVRGQQTELDTIRGAFRQNPRLQGALAEAEKEQAPPPPPEPNPWDTRPEPVELGRLDGESEGDWQLRLLLGWESCMFGLKRAWQGCQSGELATTWKYRAQAIDYLDAAEDIANHLIGRRRLARGHENDTPVFQAVLSQRDGGLWRELWHDLRVQQRDRGLLPDGFHLPSQRPLPPTAKWYERMGLEVPVYVPRELARIRTETVPGPAMKPGPWDL